MSQSSSNQPMSSERYRELHRILRNTEEIADELRGMLNLPSRQQMADVFLDGIREIFERDDISIADKFDQIGAVFDDLDRDDEEES